MKFGIFIKSYKGDAGRYDYLISSIKEYNKDDIPIYTAVNDTDINYFKNRYSEYNITFFKDSEIYNSNILNGWYSQQIIKMNFYKMGLVDNFLQVDSDSFFIQDFYLSDFMVNDVIPYTVIHENKELKEFFAKTDLYNSKDSSNGRFWVNQGFGEASKKIRKLFNTEYITAQYDYGPPPCIWSTKVWKELYENYLNPNNLSYEQLISYSNSEQQWYGETLMALNSIPIYPKQALFKVFNYRKNYYDYVNSNNLNDIKYNYIGICLQSNWASENSDEFIELYSTFFDENKKPIRYEK
jgi:hypothetical protein